MSHSDQLASDFGRSVRDLVNYDLFNTVFPQVELRSDVRAAGKWKTNQGGTYYAAGVRSQIAGRGAHVAILDDVMSEEDSFSETGRRYVKECLWTPPPTSTFTPRMFTTPISCSQFIFCSFTPVSRPI